MIEIDYKKENLEISRRYKQMLRSTYQSINREEKQMIRRAFDLAVVAHKDQRRKSGEPYIYHPIAVAQIVADEIGLGAISIAAALMHDVVEDTDYSLEDIESIFGKKIAMIIDGLTKISVLNNQDLSIQSENYRKLLLTLSEDVRVILIKIADRLHNMRTLDSMPEKKQLKIASETIFIYAPLAHRLGLYNIKSELEDLSLKYTDPESYVEIERKLQESKAEREKYIQGFTEAIDERLKEEDIEYCIKGRPKSIHSIHKKMVEQKVAFENVFDKFAIRIIYKSPNNRITERSHAWRIYSVVTDQFQPNTNRLRDWISRPKSTGYESLHITVMGLQGRWVEVQIRSERMDEIAEKGIAAHFKYKEGTTAESNAEAWINQVREMLENNSTQDTVEFIDNFKLNLYTKEIYVFTPQGDVKSLPTGATTLDFAYSVHSKVGDTCLGAKVNGKLVPLSHELQSGDQVEIITSSQQKPKRDWLDFVVTSRAKSKIKTALNADKRQIAEEGKEILIRKLRHLKINYNERIAHDIANFFGEKTAQDFWYKMGSGQIDNKDLKRFAERNTGITGFLNRFRPKSTAKKTTTEEVVDKQKLDLLVFGPDQERLDYTLATCCNPIPGDKVFGFITINKGIKVHKKDCPNAVSMRANYDYRIMEARWVDSSVEEFSALINLTGIDRLGLLNAITAVISGHLHVNMRSLNFSTNDGIFEGRIAVVVQNKAQLEKVIEELKMLEGISKVLRTYT